MGRVSAWQCDICGMTMPSDDEKEPPADWLRVYYHRIAPSDQPKNPEVNKVVCSERCAANIFPGKRAPKAKRKVASTAPKKSAVTTERGKARRSGNYGCDFCEKEYERPQALGRHLKQVHGVPSERDMLARKG